MRADQRARPVRHHARHRAPRPRARRHAASGRLGRARRNARAPAAGDPHARLLAANCAPQCLPVASRARRCAAPSCRTSSSRPARDEGPALVLTAHYDSVEASPGFGDDGIGVAVWLEVAHLLKQQPPTQPVVFLLTDGEETGLLGAQAFVDNRGRLSLQGRPHHQSRGARRARAGDDVRDRPSQCRPRLRLVEERRAAVLQLDDDGRLRTAAQLDRPHRPPQCRIERHQHRDLGRSRFLPHQSRRSRPSRPRQRAAHGRPGARRDARLPRGRLERRQDGWRDRLCRHRLAHLRVAAAGVRAGAAGPVLWRLGDDAGAPDARWRLAEAGLARASPCRRRFSSPAASSLSCCSS